MYIPSTSDPSVFISGCFMLTNHFSDVQMFYLCVLIAQLKSHPYISQLRSHSTFSFFFFTFINTHFYWSINCGDIIYTKKRPLGTDFFHYYVEGPFYFFYLWFNLFLLCKWLLSHYYLRWLYIFWLSSFHIPCLC